MFDLFKREMIQWLLSLRLPNQRETMSKNVLDFQMGTVIPTGTAFCTETAVTTVMMINMIIHMIMFSRVAVFHLHPVRGRKTSETLGVDKKRKTEARK
jgi:hypothetical protein